MNDGIVRSELQSHQSETNATRDSVRDMALKVPVALFVYNRPDHLRQTLGGLRLNRVPLVFAFSDGPKTPQQRPEVDAVRDILHQVNWCEIKIIEREQNLGLGPSIRQGVSMVLDMYDRIIVVEDDIVFRPGAYDYTAAALEHYKNSQVMTITMWSHPSLVPSGARDGFFSKRFVCWGWGTYRDAWRTYQGTPLEIYYLCKRNKFDILSWGKDLEWQAEHAAEKNLWYVGFALTHFIQNGISYFPVESLTTNIGFDGSGQNGAKLLEPNPLADVPATIPTQWPKVFIRPDTANKISNYFSPTKGNILKRIYRRLGMLFNLWRKARSKISHQQERQND